MRATLVAITAVTLSGAASSLEAQRYRCLPASDTLATALHDRVTGIVAGAGTAAASDRTRYNLPSLTASDVSILSSGAVCSAAGAAYNAAVAASGTPEVPRTRLVVIQAGKARYIVLDYSRGPGAQGVVFDAKWVKLADWPG